MNDLRNEVTLTRVRLHWGIFIPAILAMVLPIVPIGFLIFVMRQFMRAFNPSSLSLFPFLFLLVLALLPGFVLVLITWSNYLKSEITLTNQRLIFRASFIGRLVGEIPLENVEAIFLFEPALGRLFGYGTVLLTSVGGQSFPLRFIETPQIFHAALQKAVNAAKTQNQTIAKPPSSKSDDSQYMPKR